MHMLGRVAGVANRVGAALVGDARVDNEESEAEALLQRISDGRLAEDRREAVSHLKTLLQDNPQAQLMIGTMGLPVLINVLVDDRDDIELVQGALEALLFAFSEGPNPSGVKLKGEEALECQAGAINAELFARRPENVQLLLALLEDEPVGINDFYVRYYTVQLMTALLNCCAYKLQEAILKSPMGVVRLMDMLMDREAIRNEALLLLVALTRANEEIQKIAAFEGAFDRVFNIVREEGGVEGGIVVQDAFELLNNLLRKNPANQRLFREMGYLAQLGPTLQGGTGPASAELPFLSSPGTMKKQKAANLLCVLETILLLLHAPSQEDTQKAPAGLQQQRLQQEQLVQCGIMPALLALALGEGGVPSAPVRAQALHCLSVLIRDSSGNQDLLGAAVVKTKDQHEVPVLLACLHVALYGRDIRERRAALAVIQSFCLANPEGQGTLVSTAAPLGGDQNQDEMGQTFGGMLVKALVQGSGTAGLQVSCRAAAVLQHLLMANPQAKQRMLKIPLEMPTSTGSPPDYLMPRCVKYLSAALNAEGAAALTASASLLRLLITWLYDCPPAVAEFLRHPSHLPFLVDLIRQGGKQRNAMTCSPGASPNVSGMTAVLLGVCLMFASPDDTTQPGQSTNGLQNFSPTSKTVLDILLSRVGLSTFFTRLEAMRQSPQFLAASRSPDLPQAMTRAAAAAVVEREDVGDQGSPRKEDKQEEEENPFDHDFVKFVNMVESSVRNTVLTMFARPVPTALPVTAEAVASQLSGLVPEEKLSMAVHLIATLNAEMEELKARNHALAEDLLRVSQGGASSLTQGLSGTRQGESARSEETQGSPQRVLASAADVEGRVAAELRASRSEMELATTRQQLTLLQERWSHLEAELSTSQRLLHETREVAARLEQELSDLSQAYNSLEKHSFLVEGELKELQEKSKNAVAPAVSVQGGISPEELEAKLQEAVEQAREEVTQENEESMNDLLVCLGQEEEKVARLSERLRQLGQDPDELLQGIGEEEDEEEGDEEEEDGGGDP